MLVQLLVAVQLKLYDPEPPDGVIDTEVGLGVPLVQMVPPGEESVPTLNGAYTVTGVLALAELFTLQALVCTV